MFAERFAAYVPFEKQLRLYLQQDRKPIYLKRAVKMHLNHRFPCRRIGVGGPQHWPPKSPHLKPCIIIGMAA
jgi:hypothetical protein